MLSHSTDQPLATKTNNIELTSPTTHSCRHFLSTVGRADSSLEEGIDIPHVANWAQREHIKLRQIEKKNKVTIFNSAHNNEGLRPVIQETHPQLALNAFGESVTISLWDLQNLRPVPPSSQVEEDGLSLTLPSAPYVEPIPLPSLTEPAHVETWSDTLAKCKIQLVERSSSPFPYVEEDTLNAKVLVGHSFFHDSFVDSQNDLDTSKNSKLKPFIHQPKPCHPTKSLSFLTVMRFELLAERGWAPRQWSSSPSHSATASPDGYHHAPGEVSHNKIREVEVYEKALRTRLWRNRSLSWAQGQYGTPYFDEAYL